MRYFFYSKNGGEKTIIIVDESSHSVKLYPSENRVWYAHEKSSWLDYHKRMKESHVPPGEPPIFEICENQFKKFKEKGIIPENWDW